MNTFLPQLRRRAASCLSLAMTAALLSGCGGGGSDTPAPAPLPRQPAPAPEPASITLLAGRLGTEEAKDIDGTAAEARFQSPESIAADSAGNVYVTSYGPAVRNIASNGTVTMVGGHGTRLAVDAANHVWIADTSKVRRMSPAGEVTLIAGDTQESPVDGNASSARFASIRGITIGPDGTAYVTDTRTVRRVTVGGTVTTVAGSSAQFGMRDGVGAAARFGDLQGIAADRAGTMYVADGNAVRRVTANGTVTTIAGGEHAGAFADGKGATARFNELNGIAVDGAGHVGVAGLAARSIALLEDEDI